MVVSGDDAQWWSNGSLVVVVSGGPVVESVVEGS